MRAHCPSIQGEAVRVTEAVTTVPHVAIPQPLRYHVRVRSQSMKTPGPIPALTRALVCAAHVMATFSGEPLAARTLD